MDIKLSGPAGSRGLSYKQFKAEFNSQGEYQMSDNMNFDNIMAYLEYLRDNPEIFTDNNFGRDEDNEEFDWDNIENFKE